MVTPKEAYDIVKKEYEDIGAVEEYDKCYVVIDKSLDLDHGVDKETGEVFDVWINDLIELMKPYDPDEGIEPKVYEF